MATGEIRGPRQQLEQSQGLVVGYWQGHWAGPAGRETTLAHVPLCMRPLEDQEIQGPPTGLGVQGQSLA